MNRTEPKTPEGKYYRAKLTAPLGPLMPAGKIGWLSADVETIDADGKPMFRFISATNHDLVFKVYAEEVIIE
jgi:hypothetical protein